jgi:hypothetical protein
LLIVHTKCARDSKIEGFGRDCIAKIKNGD